MQIINDVKLNFDDVLIVPQRSYAASRKDVKVERAFKLRNGNEMTCVPIIASNMDATGTIEMSKTLKKYNALTCLHKYYTKSRLEISLNRNNFITIGAKEKDLDFLYDVCRFTYIPNICIDVANGYMDTFVEFVKEVRNHFPQANIMAGNVVTPEMTQELILQGGVDIVKIGIGPGSVCTTRLMTGVGYPQLSAIIECANAAHGLGARICADGGCKNAGDVVKAFAAGADFVMLGGMFAGCDECEGEWIYKEECFGDFEIALETKPHNMMWGPDFNGVATRTKTHLKFYGMSSREAMKKYNNEAEYKTGEGKCVEIPYKGPAENVLKEVLGGLRSACAYVGAKELRELSKRATFVRVNNSQQENRVFT